MIEQGHKPIVDALTKMSNGGLQNWVKNLSAVAKADQTTVETTIRHTPFYLNCGQELVMPIELDFLTWKVLSWTEIRGRGEFIAMRARQIQKRDKNLQKAALLKQQSREHGKKAFDKKKRLRSKKLKEGTLVLFHDTKLINQHTHKLNFRWLGSYRIAKIIPDKHTYFLEELNGTALAGTFAGNRIKEFGVWQLIERDAMDNSQGPTNEEEGEELKQS